MKQDLLDYLDKQSEYMLAKMLNWAYTQQQRIDDATNFEQRTAKMIAEAMYHLEKPQ
jgi:uncharacterized protein (DUF2164 family)